MLQCVMGLAQAELPVTEDLPQANSVQGGNSKVIKPRGRYKAKPKES
jgi:hypothetical protein